ncbi:MAG: DUF3857 domain-containing protein, partial [Calditrichaeota bacterium]
PEADAIVLHSVGEIEIFRNGSARTHRQIAYRLLTHQGLFFSVCSLRYAPFEKIKKLKGWLLKRNGKSISLEKNNILDVSSSQGAGYYEDDLIRVAALPGADPGDVVAFEWEIEEEKGWTGYYHTFEFQRQQPVKFSRCRIKIPRGWELHVEEWNTAGIQFEHTGELYVWTARDLPYQPQEPLAPDWDFLARRVTVSCFDPQRQIQNHFADWKAVARWCAALFQEPSTATGDIVQTTQHLLQDKPSFADKLRAIADFTQDEIRYVAVEIGKSRWRPRRAEKTLYNRYGDCKDKTALMRALLSAANIPSVPVLVSVSDPLFTNVPTPFQFDHCVIAIPIEEHQVYSEFQNAIVHNYLIFDPTDSAVELGHLPWHLQGRKVLLGLPGDSVLL